MIRRYEKGDTPQLLQALSSNMPTYFHPSEAEAFKCYLTQSTNYFVFLEEEKIVGGCGAEVDDTTGKVSWSFVASSWQGQGIGNVLLRHCIGILQQDSQVQKIVVRTSQLTNRFFEKYGFKEQYREKDFWAPGLDLVYMKM